MTEGLQSKTFWHTKGQEALFFISWTLSICNELQTDSLLYIFSWKEVLTEPIGNVVYALFILTFLKYKVHIWSDGQSENVTSQGFYSYKHIMWLSPSFPLTHQWVLHVVFHFSFTLVCTKNLETPTRKPKIKANPCQEMINWSLFLIVGVLFRVSFAGLNT